MFPISVSLTHSLQNSSHHFVCSNRFAYAALLIKHLLPATSYCCELLTATGLHSWAAAAVQHVRTLLTTLLCCAVMLLL
jgi:hypothetical protein